MLQKLKRFGKVLGLGQVLECFRKYRKSNITKGDVYLKAGHRILAPIFIIISPGGACTARGSIEVVSVSE